MKILDLCDKYFLIMMLVQGFVILIIDYNYFKNKNAIPKSKKAKTIGLSGIIISIVLFALRMTQ